MDARTLRTSSMFTWSQETLYVRAGPAPDTRAGLNVKHLLDLVFIEMERKRITVPCRMEVDSGWVVSQCVEWMVEARNRDKILTFTATDGTKTGQLPIMDITNFLLESRTITSFRLLGSGTFEGLNSHASITQMLGAMCFAEHSGVFGNNLKVITMSVYCYDHGFENWWQTARDASQLSSGRPWETRVLDETEGEDEKILFMWRRTDIHRPREPPSPRNIGVPRNTRRRMEQHDERTWNLAVPTNTRASISEGRGDHDD